VLDSHQGRDLSFRCEVHTASHLTGAKTHYLEGKQLSIISSSAESRMHGILFPRPLLNFIKLHFDTEATLSFIYLFNDALSN